MIFKKGLHQNSVPDNFKCPGRGVSAPHPSPTLMEVLVNG